MNNLDITDKVTFDSITQEMFPFCRPRVCTCMVYGELLETMIKSTNRFNIYIHSGVEMVVQSADSRGNVTLVEIRR